MSDERLNSTRRRVLTGIGAAAATGAVGVGALSGGASASSDFNIDTSNTSVSTAHGEVDRVSVQPDISINWSGFDEVVGKVRILVEASPHDVASEEVGDFAPVFRATMWLNESGSFNNNGSIASRDDGEAETGPGYNGEAHARGVWFAGQGGITLYDRHGPDYSGLSRSEDYFSGTSVGQEYSKGDYFENGIYDQAGTVNRFFNETDDSTEGNEVTLRYTISFHAPGSGIADGYDIPEEDVAEKSPLVMAAADDVSSPITNHHAESIPYGVLQNNADGHPAIMTTEETFSVNVTNENSTGSSSGSSNTGASGSDTIEQSSSEEQ